MKRPPCQKCGSTNVYLQEARVYKEEPSIACYSCGWRCYGDENIKRLVVSYNMRLEVEERHRKRLEEEKRRAALELRRAEEERKRIEAWKKQREEDRKKREEALHLVLEDSIPGVPFVEGDMDPILQVPWRGPSVTGDRPSCSWPPCENRAREKSKYCSRKCTVNVARRRDRLRKKGLLEEPYVHKRAS